MAFLVISFANNFENMVLVNFLFSFTRKKHPNNSSELLACSSDHNLQSGGPSYLFLWMASLSPPSASPPPPRAKKERLLGGYWSHHNHVVFPSNSFLPFFSCKHCKKLHCFVNRHCKPRVSYLCCLFFFLGFLPIVPYLGYFWWVSSLLSSSDWFEGLCKCGTFLWASVRCTGWFIRL